MRGEQEEGNRVDGGFLIRRSTSCYGRVPKLRRGRKLPRVSGNPSPEIEPRRSGQAIIVPVELGVCAQNFQSAADQQRDKGQVAEVQRSKPEWKVKRMHTTPPLNGLAVVRPQLWSNQYC